MKRPIQTERKKECQCINIDMGCLFTMSMQAWGGGCGMAYYLWFEFCIVGGAREAFNAIGEVRVVGAKDLLIRFASFWSRVQ